MSRTKTHKKDRIYRDLTRLDPPTREEEVALVRRAHDGDKAAEDELVARNMRLVFDLARRYKTPGATFEDLVQEGTIGLIKAVRKFDPDRGYRFSTVAHWWIRQGISRFVKGPTRLIRLPEYLQDRIARAYRAREDLATETGLEPTDADVAHEIGVEAGDVGELMRLSRDASSLDNGLADNSDISVHETLADDRVGTPDEELERRSARAKMVDGLRELPQRQTRILAYRYGLADGQKRSRPWIGKKLGLSAERVRQLENSALKRLRKDMGELAAAA